MYILYLQWQHIYTCVCVYTYSLFLQLHFIFINAFIFSVLDSYQWMASSFSIILTSRRSGMKRDPGPHCLQCLTKSRQSRVPQKLK